MGNDVNLCKDCPHEHDWHRDFSIPTVDTYPPQYTVVCECGEAKLITQEPAQPLLVPEWKIEKYDGEVTPEQIAAGEVKPVEVLRIPGNMVVNSGINRMLDLLIGAGGQASTNTHTFMGVGDSATAAAAGQTDLQAGTGGTHRQWKAMDSTYPSRSSQTLSFRSTFGTTEANFAWVEMGIEIDDGTSSPGTAALSTGTQKLFNRKVISAGTKTNAQTWVATYTLTTSSQTT